MHLAIPISATRVLPHLLQNKRFEACHLVLAVVGAPTAAAVVVPTAVATTESTAVVAVAALLVAALLVTEAAEAAAVLAVAGEVAGVAAEALLVRLLLVQALCALARGALGGGTGTALLSSQSGLAGSCALGVAEALHRVVALLLAALLLAVGALATCVPGSAEGVRKTTEATGARCGAVVLSHAGS